jgi:hypothetical protein
MKKVTDQQTKVTNDGAHRGAVQDDSSSDARIGENHEASPDGPNKSAHGGEGPEASLDHPGNGAPEGSRNNGSQESAPDPFDPKRLALGQDFAGALGVKKLTTHVPVRKPHKHEWFRVHPDPPYRLQTTLLALKGDREELYVVPPELRVDLAGELSLYELFTAINRENVVFLIAIKLPGPDGRLNTWTASFLDGIGYARERWVRISSRMAVGAYETFSPEGHLPDPEWPTTSLADLLRIAFRDHIIDSLDHPVVRLLRGKA